MNGRSVHLEESGEGSDFVVFEAGSGQGRTAWDPVLPLLAHRARLVVYDRAGFGRSGRIKEQLGIDEMASDLVGMIEAAVPTPARLVLVGHSMGGLVARRAAERLGSRLSGLVLVDPTPESAPIYDHFDRTARTVNVSLLVGQALVAPPPMAWLSSGKVRRIYPRDTYKAMLTEDFTPSGMAQTRKEFRAVAEAIHQFRADPPAPPTCPTVLLSPTRPLRRGENRQLISEYQQRYVDTLTDGRFQSVESRHFIQAEQPSILADNIVELLDRADLAAGQAPDRP